VGFEVIALPSEREMTGQNPGITFFTAGHSLGAFDWGAPTRVPMALS